MVGASIPLMALTLAVWNGGEGGLCSSITAFFSMSFFIVCMICGCGVFFLSDIAVYSFILGLFLLFILVFITFFGRHFEIKRRYKKIEKGKK